jgi:hypothetical protein
MFLLKSRRERERIIAGAMIHIYCAALHRSATGSLCPECFELEAYAGKRLRSCQFGEAKPVCKRCPVHCYSPAKKESMKEVMRFSGPLILRKHPFYALTHLLDNLTARKPGRVFKAR